MPLKFNALLLDAGVSPASVRLLRHETKRYRGRTPYTLWRDDPAKLNRYQSTQLIARRSWFGSPNWASFVVSPDGQTLFVGLYAVGAITPVPPGWWHDLNDEPLNGDLDERYDLVLRPELEEYVGRLTIDWGAGTRSWVQLAANQDKRVLELRRELVDPPFPGYLSLIFKLSELESLPATWIAALGFAKGVYLLTCPKTREQYIGSASGIDGFIGRWRVYAETGHGGNVALKSRDPSDYQVSILQVAGSADDERTILAMEALWKAKLQSRDMGLNRN